MGEIGSEFWDVPQSNIENGIFPKFTQWFISGRSALQAIIKELKDCRTIAMPSWCCESMVKPFVDAEFEVYFYPVYLDEDLVQAVNFDCDVLFLMDYFGYTGIQPDLSGYSGVVIRDITHSFLSISYSDADYYFGSLRKWCGVWTGGYVWTRDGHKLNVEITNGHTNDYGYLSLRERAMQLKSEYINSQNVAEKTVDKSYLCVFNEAEEVLETIGIVPASERDEQVALKLDVQFIKTQRRRNAEILCKAFSDWLIFREMKETDCPMFVPILVPECKRNGLRQHLINNEIYCPVHWPVSKYFLNANYTDVSKKIIEKMNDIYANELSLVCDQRYTEADMNRMVDTIRKFWKEG